MSQTHGSERSGAFRGLGHSHDLPNAREAMRLSAPRRRHGAAVWRPPPPTSQQAGGGRLPPAPPSAQTGTGVQNGTSWKGSPGRCPVDTGVGPGGSLLTGAACPDRELNAPVTAAPVYQPSEALGTSTRVPGGLCLGWSLYLPQAGQELSSTLYTLYLRPPGDQPVLRQLRELTPPRDSETAPVAWDPPEQRGPRLPSC